MVALFSVNFCLSLFIHSSVFLSTFVFVILPFCLSFGSPSPDKLMRRAHLRDQSCVGAHLSHYHLIITPLSSLFICLPSPPQRHILIMSKYQLMLRQSCGMWGNQTRLRHHVTENKYKRMKKYFVIDDTFIETTLKAWLFLLLLYVICLCLFSSPLQQDRKPTGIESTCLMCWST